MKDYEEHHVASYHDYDLDRLGDAFYDKPPGSSERGGSGKCYVTVVLKQYHFRSVDDDLREKMAEALLSEADRQRIIRHLNGDDWANMIYYRVYADAEGLRKYIAFVVKTLVDRASWLDCEDDHCDFYHSSLEFLAQIVEIADASDLLTPLQDVLSARVKCPYCNSHGEDCMYPCVFKSIFPNV